MSTVALGCWLRLTRTVRPAAAPTWSACPGWNRRLWAALIGSAATAAAMVWIDPWTSRAVQGVMPPGLASFFRLVTDLGRSAWSLIPTCVGIVTIMALVRPARTFVDRVALALAMRLAFVFIAVGASGLIVTVVKRIIGRARPALLESHGSTHFEVLTWKPIFASFPSVHAQAAMAFSTALSVLLPSWRIPLLMLGAAVALTRASVEAHYLTDVIVGGAWGVWFTLMCREWFGRRGLVFSTDASRRPVLMSGHRLTAAVRAITARQPGAWTTAVSRGKR